MSQFGFRSSRFVPPQPQRPKAAVPLAIGSRAIVTSAQELVTLTERDGNTPAGTIAAGMEVMIDAWIPPRDGGLRYLVAAPSGAAYGWLHPDFLTVVPRPAPPKPVVALAAAAPARVRRVAGRKAAPKAAAATVAAKGPR